MRFIWVYLTVSLLHPQILAASILGFLITKVFDNQPVYALVIGGCSMLIAGVMTLRVKIPE